MVRPDKVLGATYKLRWPDSEHAMYMTINDIEQDGRAAAVRDLRQLARTWSTTPGWWR